MTRVSTWFTGRRLIITVLVVWAVGVFIMELLCRLALGNIDILVANGSKPGMHTRIAGTRTNPFCAYTYTPNTTLTDGRRVSAQGFVSTSYLSRNRESTEIRIAFLGGSLIAGAGLDDKQTLPQIVEHELGKHFPSKKVVCLNCAVEGYTSFESLGRLFSQIRLFEPSILVVSHGWSELVYFHPKTLASISQWRVSPESGAVFVHRQACRLAPWHSDNLMAWSQFYSHFRSWFSPALPIDVPSEPAVADTKATFLWSNNLRLFRGAAVALKTPLFVVKGPHILSTTSTQANISKKDLAALGLAKGQCFRALHFIDTAVDSNIPKKYVIDASSLSGKKELFSGATGLTEQGSQELATIITERLVTVLSKMAKAK